MNNNQVESVDVVCLAKKMVLVTASIARVNAHHLQTELPALKRLLFQRQRPSLCSGFASTSNLQSVMLPSALTHLNASFFLHQMTCFKRFWTHKLLVRLTWHPCNSLLPRPLSIDWGVANEGKNETQESGSQDIYFGYFVALHTGCPYEVSHNSPYGDNPMCCSRMKIYV